MMARRPRPAAAARSPAGGRGRSPEPPHAASPGDHHVRHRSHLPRQLNPPPPPCPATRSLSPLVASHPPMVTALLLAPPLVLVLRVVYTLCAIGAARALIDQPATPLLGFSTWNCFEGRFNESVLREVADVMCVRPCWPLPASAQQRPNKPARQPASLPLPLSLSHWPCAITFQRLGREEKGLVRVGYRYLNIGAR
jgi:hypothetical protein